MARMPFGRHRPRPRPGGGTLIAGLSISVSPSALYVGGAFTVTVTVPAGGTLSTVAATAGGTPVALTGSGNIRTGTAPAEAGPLVVTATGEDADGNQLTDTRTVQVREEPVAPTAPGQFTTSDWSVTTGLAASQVVLNVSALPSDGGSPITALQYTVDGGSTWTALSGTGTGSRTLTMPAAGTAYTFALRAVNAVGAGVASATKNATSGAEEPVSTLRRDLVWAFGDSKTAYTSDQTTVSTLPQNTKAGADGGWMAILESLENHRFTFIGKTAVGGWSSTDLAANVDAGIAAAIASGCGTATLLVGSNDMPGNTNPTAAVPASFVSNVATIISKIQAAGMQIILMNEWPAAPNDMGDGAIRTKLPLGNWYKAQQEANAYPGVIWVDTFGGLGGFTDEIDPEDFALGTVRSDAHASYQGARKVANLLRPAFEQAIPSATYGTPLFSVSKDRPATDYVSLNPTLSGVNASPTSGITGQIPLNHLVNATPTLIGSTLAVAAAIDQDADGENVVTFTVTGECTAQTIIRMYSIATRVLPTQEELTGKCFAAAGTINVSEISKFKAVGIYVALTGAGITRNFHAAQKAGTDGSVTPYNVTGPVELKCVTPMGKLAPTANPTNVSTNFTFTIPVGTYNGETISVKRMAAGFVPAADYVAP